MPKKTEKFIPLRKCVGCFKMLPKESLTRVVKNKAGELFIDESGKADGRGAYICKSAECVKAAKKARRFEKAFKMPMTAEFYSKLEQG